MFYEGGIDSNSCVITRGALSGLDLYFRMFVCSQLVYQYSFPLCLRDFQPNGIYHQTEGEMFGTLNELNVYYQSP